MKWSRCKARVCVEAGLSRTRADRDGLLGLIFVKTPAMPANEWYRDWFNSIYYHKLYFHHGEVEAHRFLQKLLDLLKPAPAASMVDVGCGRGRHARFLASKGYDVTGIDLSPDSISFAKQYETDNLRFYQHDMRLPAWMNYFDYAFNFFTSFGYFATRRENDDAVRTIAQSLKPNGIALFDYLNVHYVEEHFVHEETKTIDAIAYHIRRWDDEGFFYKRIIINDAEPDKPLEFTERVAKLSLGDFTEMLAYQKMQVEEVFGDYDLNNYDVKKTPRLIVAARKAD